MTAYYTLLTTSDTDPRKYEIVFGDHDRYVVDQEKHDLMRVDDQGHGWKIIRTDEDQASIDAEVARLNGRHDKPAAKPADKPAKPAPIWATETRGQFTKSQLDVIIGDFSVAANRSAVRGNHNIAFKQQDIADRARSVGFFNKEQLADIARQMNIEAGQSASEGFFTSAVMQGDIADRASRVLGRKWGRK